MKQLLLVLLLCTAWAHHAEAVPKGRIGTQQKIGLGIGGGTMTNGVTGKIFLNRKNAIQGFAGIGKWGLAFGGGYVRTIGTLWKGRPGRCFWSLGLDASVMLYDEQPSTFHLLSVSAIIELGWHTSAVPLEVILDYRPSFFIGEIHPGLKLNVAGAALRWFF
jgi:hypothetical protein